MNENPLFWDEDDDTPSVFSDFINSELNDQPIDDATTMTEQLEPQLAGVLARLNRYCDPGPYFTHLMTPRQQLLHARLSAALVERFRGNRGLWLSQDELIKEVIAQAWLVLLQCDDTIVRRTGDDE